MRVGAVPVAKSLTREDRHHGLRQDQNGIGGSSRHPLGAPFVPPPASQVHPLIEDLAYLTGSVHAPLVQAALVHAQFDTMHPVTDGNGRVGSPDPHFLSSGHEVGAAVGVAVVSAIATAAGDLTDPASAVDAASRGFTAAALLAVGFAAIAFWRMPAAGVEAGAAGTHVH